MDLDAKRITRLVALLAAGLVCLATSLHAGIGGFGRRGVGGVMIDGAGVLRAATVAEQREFADLVAEAIEPAGGDFAESTDMRMVSLKGLQQAIVESADAGSLPEEVEFLAGLQRIEFVFVDSQKNDIVIAGPAEPWIIRGDGSVVGKTSGGSTLRLADLVVALQSVEMARNGGISCSIEPTAEGRDRLRKFLSSVQLNRFQNPKVFEPKMKEAFGPQMIHLAGVRPDSRYARTLVAADFEMKRIAMGLRPSPIAELPSYLQMSRNARHSASENPRWWMACNYEGLTRSEDGMAWKLTGQGVKTMTEQDIRLADGSVKGSGRVGKLAQNWATQMTDSFSDLAREVSVFSDLQGVMDMTVLATLIVQERLDAKAGLDLSVLAEEHDAIQLTSYEIPRSVDPQCSFIRGNNRWVVTASGGVDINAFQVVEDQSVDNQIAGQRKTALAATTDRWWWNR